MVETEEAMDVKEEIGLHLEMAKAALNQNKKQVLITQLTLALEKAQEEM